MSLWLVGLSLAAMVDRIAAVVNDEVIALSEVYELGGEFFAERCPQGGDSCLLDLELEILDVQIRRTLIRQELDRLDLQVTASDVDQAIDDTIRQYPQISDRAGLRAEVEAQGQRWDQYREELFEFLRTQRFQGRLLAPRISLNDDEVRDRFKRESRKMTKPTATVSGFGIVVPQDADQDQIVQITTDAVALVAALNAGELAWEDAVEEHDLADVSSMFGREVVQGELVEGLDAVIFSAEVGVVQPPLRLGTMLFIVRVDARGERALTLPFEEVEEQIRNQMFQEKLTEAEEEWYQRARREATIEVKLR
ncbi:MAG TPA: hypothetical protein ENK18_02070 [Deltaproteobacteria bacterium]|nr:hypothetical protein [Deltaproteobacteria bacterium]